MRLRLVFGSGQRRSGPDGGSQVVIRSDDGRLRLKAKDESRLEKRQVSQYLVVMENQPARITVGKSVPFTESLHAVCRRHGVLLESIDYRDVDTGFEVYPEVYGEQVQLDIRPFMAFLNPRDRRQIVFQELATKVRVPLDSWFDLGGHMSSQNDVSREIMATGRQEADRQSSVRLRVEIQ